MIPMREQWFRIYAFTPGVAGPVIDPKTKAVTVGWLTKPKWELESNIEHVHHPDSYHPDARVKIAHHRKIQREGVAVAACGHLHDPRMRFVETEGKPEKPCPGCLAVTEKAVFEHAVARASLERVAAEKAAAVAADFDQEEIPTGH